jgi:hypothetical protein
MKPTRNLLAINTLLVVAALLLQAAVAFTLPTVVTNGTAVITGKLGLIVPGPTDRAINDNGWAMSKILPGD